MLSDLASDLPTTEEDVRVLRNLRRQSSPTPFDDLQRLVDQLPRAAREARRATAEGWEPFELPPDDPSS